MLNNFFSCFWHSPSSVPNNSKLYHTSVALMLSYAFMKISFYDTFKLAEPLFAALCLYIFFRFSGSKRHSFPVFIFFSSIFLALTVWILGSLNHPELIDSTPQLERLARAFVFVFMAFLLAGDEKNIGTFFFLSALGLLFSPWTHGEGWHEIHLGLKGHRIDFGIHNAQHTGVLFGSALLGLLVFSKRILANGRFFYCKIALWLLSLTFILFVFWATQVRAAILSLLIVFIAFIAITVTIKKKTTSLKSISFLVAPIILIIFIFSYLGMSGMPQRTNNELSVLDFVMKGDLENIPHTSLGLRIHSWRAASEWFVERPLFGWGNKGGSIVIEQTEWLQGTRAESFGHLHNSYFETAIRFGSIGLLLYLLLALWAAKNSWKAYKKGVIPNDYFLFFILFFIYWFIVNLFESYMYYWTGIYIFNIVMAGLLSFIWKAQDKEISVQHKADDYENRPT